jgi:hypothetical protein
MSTITAEQEQAIADLLARTPHLAVGMGTETRPCSVAAINLALTGSLTGAIPECMSQVIGFWIRSAQDAAPADICRDHPRWRELLPLAAGTGREHEVERSDAVVAWMWDVLALPLAVCGSIVGLFIMHESVNLFSLLGIVMLLGVASKNSILLVDHAVKKMAEGANSVDAMLDAGRKRLRPILMTTMALIAGIMPIAIGLNEASKQRTCMGVAIIGGLVSSTLLTLVVVPAAFILIEGGRSRLLKLWNRKDASSGETHKVA